MVSSKILVVVVLIALLAGVGIGYVIPREAGPAGVCRVKYQSVFCCL